jgi:precorrin-3B synthase
VVAARLDRPAGAVRGACPSVHEPFVALDGALLRVRVPGGRLHAGAVRAIANVAGRRDAIELTNRANVQVRGVEETAVGAVVDALVRAGVVLADAGADERRNVLASPTAGIDPDELLDTRTLVDELVQFLASDAAAGISPKFGVLVDGGGRTHVRGRAHDVALGAVRVDDAAAYELQLAGALPFGARTGDAVVVAPGRVLDVVRAVVRAVTRHGRVREWLDVCGADRALAALDAAVPGALRTVAAGDLAAAPAAANAPVGVVPTRDPDRVAIGCVPVLGRLDGATFAALADVADAHGDSEVRLTPWRGVVLAGISRAKANDVIATCTALGLACELSHPATAVVACAGSRGCASGCTDAPADARRLVAALGAVAPAARPALVHVSGCGKGCAYPGTAPVTLVGTSPGRYDFVRAGTVVAYDVDVETALRAASGPA